ncbi:MAG: DUF3631 domain-containing protein [Acidobacteria bacterium]|nr:DUF3631 domain-containing protein [Acidobacteriota bacterium]
MAEDYKTRKFLEQHPELIPQVESITPQIVDKVTRGANVVNGWHSSMPGAPTASEEEKEALVADVERFVSKYVIFPQQHMALVLALWAIGTHTFDSFDCFPYLTVTSPTKQCGKTRLAEVLELLCAEPLRAANLSEAVLFRLVEKMSPTLIIDEAEPLGNKKSERAQAIVSLLNAGHRKGSKSYRCYGPGHEPKAFRVYCPKMIIAIKNVPETVRDRSLAVQMQRKKANDAVGRFIFKQVRGPAADLKERIAGIISVCRQDIEGVYDSYELEFLSDREAENWTPLFCLCSVLIPPRLAELRETAIAFSKGKAAFDADDSLQMRLLSDIQAILGNNQSDTLFGEKLAAISSSALVAKLREAEEAPWAGYDLSARRLAQLLKPFEVHPRQVRDGSSNIRGYAVADLIPLFSRYLG